MADIELYWALQSGTYDKIQKRKEMENVFLILYFTVSNVVLKTNLSYLFCRKRKSLTSRGIDYRRWCWIYDCDTCGMLDNQNSWRLGKAIKYQYQTDSKSTTIFFVAYTCFSLNFGSSLSHFQPALSTDGTHCYW